MMRPFHGACAVLLLVVMGWMCGCHDNSSPSPNPSSLPSSLPSSRPAPSITIQDWHAAAGVAKYYLVSPAELSVVRHDDYGSAPRTLWSMPLTPAQRSEFERLASSIRLDKLADNYSDPNVMDGQLLRFVFTNVSAGPRTIEVWNTEQPDLKPLVQFVNRVVPEKHLIRWPEARTAFILPSTGPSNPVAP